MSLSLKDFYAGQTVFLTGTTGFIGKVLLEKLLRSLPQIKRIYIMVRSKKLMTVQERMMSTIFSSEIFERLWKEQPNLKKQILTKVVPIAGDLVIDGLGMSKQDRQTLINELDVIINVAASTNFDDPILEAIQINYFGVLRCLQLAKECKKLKAMTHCSTAYVNSNQQSGSLIEERVYDLPDGKEPEDLIADIMKMNPQQVIEQEKQLIGAYPNTYTWSKSMAERSLKKERSGIKLSIVRPSIVISCDKEPLAGWTETISAAGGISYAAHMGLLHCLNANPSVILDIIPADLVSNMIIAATVYTAQEVESNLNVFHSTSSSLKPATINDVANAIIDSCIYNPWHKQVFQPNFQLTPGKYYTRIIQILYERLPRALLSGFADITGDKVLKKQSQELKKVQVKMQSLQDIFIHFIKKEWVYDMQLIDKMLIQMSQEESQTFNFDPRRVVWKDCLEAYFYGIRRFFIKEDCLSPELNIEQIVPKNHFPWFADIRYASVRGYNYQQKSLNNYYQAILSPQRYRDFLKKRMKLKERTSNPNEKVTEAQTRKNAPYLISKPTFLMKQDLAKQQLKEMAASLNNNGIRSLIWGTHKLARSAVQGLHVDVQSIEKVKSLISEGKRVVLVPVYKSFVDITVLTYVLNFFSMEQPFMFGNYEDAPRIKVMDAMLRSSGYIFQRRERNQSVQSWYINYAMLKEVIEDNSLTVLFQNAYRPRTGKLNQRSKSDVSIQWLLEAYMNIPLQSKNLTLVPVMINYDRLLDARNLTTEMMTGKKEHRSTSYVYKKMINFKQNQMGSIFVKFLEPIRLSTYLENNKVDLNDQAQFLSISHKLTMELYKRQAVEIPITLNSLISALLLSEQTNKSSVIEMGRKLDFLLKYIKHKTNCKTYMSISPQQPIIEKHVQGLGLKVSDKGKKTASVHLDKIRDDWLIQLSLAHYSLALSSVFMMEFCFIQLANVHFNYQNQTTPLSVKGLYEKGVRFAEFFKREHLIEYKNDYELFVKRIKFMAAEKFCEYDEKNETVSLIKENERTAHLLKFFSSTSLVFLDAYLIVLIAVQQIAERQLIVKREIVVNQLRNCVKILYSERVVTHVHSCIDDILDTALSKYQEMGLVQIVSYDNKWGSTSEFLQATREQHEAIQEPLDFLHNLRPITAGPKSNGKQDDKKVREIQVGKWQNGWEATRMQEEVENALQIAQGPYEFARM